jgi:hypothetical protein
MLKGVPQVTHDLLFGWGGLLVRLCCHLARNRLAGVIVSVLAIGPKVRRFKPSRGDGFLRAIKIRSTSSFTGEVNPEAPCRKILRLVKNRLKVWTENFARFKKNHRLGQVSTTEPWVQWHARLHHRGDKSPLKMCFLFV